MGRINSLLGILLFIASPAQAIDPPDVYSSTPNVQASPTGTTSAPPDTPEIKTPTEFAIVTDKLVCPDETTIKKETWEDLGNSESCYKGDKKHGPSHIFMNGKLYSTENYKHGKLEGEAVIFEESGKQSKYYKSGELVSSVIWYLNGNKKIENIYGKDPKNPKVRYYHEDGTEASSNPDSETAYWLNKLPEDVKKSLDASNPGWKLLGFTITRPPVLFGDLNGDSKPDCIILIKAGKISKAIAFLVSDKGFNAYDIVELGAETSNAAVVHGAKNDNIRFSGEKSGITYEFNGKGFSKLGE